MPQNVSVYFIAQFSDAKGSKIITVSCYWKPLYSVQMYSSFTRNEYLSIINIQWVNVNIYQGNAQPLFLQNISYKTCHLISSRHVRKLINISSFKSKIPCLSTSNWVGSGSGFAKNYSDFASFSIDLMTELFFNKYLQKYCTRNISNKILHHFL